MPLIIKCDLSFCILFPFKIAITFSKKNLWVNTIYHRAQSSGINKCRHSSVWIFLQIDWTYLTFNFRYSIIPNGVWVWTWWWVPELRPVLCEVRSESAETSFTICSIPVSFWIIACAKEDEIIKQKKKWDDERAFPYCKIYYTNRPIRLSN